MSEFAITVINETYPIIRQNENGPCFIIALVNTILIIELTKPPNDYSIINSKARLFTNLLLSRKNENQNYKVNLDVLNSFIISCFPNDSGFQITEILDTLPSLNTGLSINPSFDNNLITDFGKYTNLLIEILNFFNISIYHGFIMPQDLIFKLKDKNVNPDFDACQDFLVSNLDNSENDHLFNDIKEFLDSNMTEITQTGCDSLLKILNENEVCIFFRNDHFNTCLKRDNVIYLLVTDIGYIQQPDIIWTPLNIYDEGDFYNFDFQLSTIKQQQEQHHQKDESQEQQETADMLLAKQLQLEEDENISKAMQQSINNNESRNTAKKNHDTPPHQLNDIQNAHMSKSKLKIKSKNTINRQKPSPESQPTSKSKSKPKSKSKQDNNCVIV
jgi:hypothetical protein